MACVAVEGGLRLDSLPYPTNLRENRNWLCIRREQKEMGLNSVINFLSLRRRSATAVIQPSVVTTLN